MRIPKSHLIFVFFMFLFRFSYGSEVLWNVRLEGSAIHNGNLAVQDGDFNQLNSGTFVDVGPKTFGYIRLGMGEVPGMSYTNGTTHYKLRLSITPFSNTGVAQSPITTYLEAVYSGLENKIIVDAEDYRLMGVHKFIVDVAEISKSTNEGLTYTPVYPTESLPVYMYLEAGFSAERYYELNTSQIPVAVHNYISYDDQSGAETKVYNQGAIAVGSTIDEIELSWNYVDGAEYYDLEWTWVDNYSASSLSGVRQQNEVGLTELEFQHNSSRIRTGDQHYRIPQIFAKGYLIYRVRGVGRWLVDVSKDKYGAWSGNTNPQKTLVSEWAATTLNVITIGAEHEGLKNWQYDATYAEEGKKKEVAQYFDGSLRQRQIVTRLNSDNHSVVGETVYDNEGRGVIQILPVPQSNPGIQYYQQLNKNSTGIPYSYKDFDLEDTSATCTPSQAGAMSASSGASRYYSPGAHMGETDWQQYVPDAKGYPFSQVEYTPDNTGRVRSQSGVGIDHRIGGNHQTIYYYLQPAQEELNRLFGYKVGYKQRYKKNMVVDANGQVSISYLDASGKVIATALAGDKPSSESTGMPLSGLGSESASNHGNLTIDILGKLNQSAPDTPDDNNDLMISGRFGGLNDGLKSGTQLAVAKNGSVYTFDYKATTSYFTAACGESGINYPFVYDITFSLKNDCGEEKFTHTYAAVGEQQFSSNATDFINLLETVSLDKGSYTVYKEITVNEASLLAYKAHYLDPETGCILGPAAFSDTVEFDCDYETCASCIAELGTWAEYLNQASLDAGHEIANGSNEYTAILTVYNNLREQCLEPCRPLTNCEVYRESMLTDLKPQGQYGGTTPGDVLSIFNNTSTSKLRKGSGPGFGSVCNWQNPPTPYLDENGNPSLIPVTITYSSTGTVMSYTPNITSPVNLVTINGSSYIRPQYLANAADFIAYFEPGWSEVFFPYHPEYDFYLYAEEICAGEKEIPATSTTTSEVFKVSSEVFNDLILNQAMTYAQANGLETTLDGLNFYTVDLLPNTASTYGGLYEIDPYFHQNYPVHALINTNQVAVIPFPHINVLTLKNSLMESYLLNYENSNMSMLSYAAKTVLQTSVPPYLTWNDILSDYPNQKDLIWQTFKSYYISYKLRINQLLMDVYGYTMHRTIAYEIPAYGPQNISVGQFNGAIGVGGVNSGVFPTFQDNSNFSSVFALLYNTYTKYTPGSGWSVNASPSYFRGAEYDSKEIRITRFDALSDPSLADAVAIEELSAQGDYALWQATGLCPLTLDFERFLDAQGKAGALTYSGDLSAVGTFTPDMFKALTGSAPDLGSSMNVSPTISGSLSLQFTSTVPSSSQTIVIPQIGPFSWSTYGTSWNIYGVSHSFPVASSAYDVKILVRAGTSLANSEEYVVTYHSPIDLNGCQTEYQQNGGNLDPECEKEKKFESAMLGLMQKLMENQQFYSFPNQVNISNYPEYINSVLPEYLGMTPGVPVFWLGPNAVGTMGISQGSGSTAVSFTIPLPGFPTNFTSITAFSLVGGKVYVNGISSDGSYLYSGAYSYEHHGVKPLVLDLSCPCNGGEKTPEQAIADYLTYIYTHPSIPCGSQPAELVAIKEYLPFSNPVVYNLLPTISGPVIQHAEQGTPCVEGSGKDPCEIAILSTSSLIGASNVVLTATGFTFTGHLANGSTENVTVRAACLTIPPCTECLPQPESPVSCTEAYTAYNNNMHDLLPYTDPEELAVFETRYVVNDSVFCANGYAYISEAYKMYLDGLSISSVTDLRYLSLAQFGNTPLGYSNDKLITALMAYFAYLAPPTNGTLDWNNYVRDIYMPANPGICPATSPPSSLPSGPFDGPPCNQWEQFAANVNQQNQYELYLIQAGNKFVRDYLSGALSSLVEKFTESHADKEYHYTLYYYDRAGNLIQTVPPQGVDRLEVGDANTLNNDQINALRVSVPSETNDVNATSAVKQAPEHSMKTVYRYNSLNQLVYQNTPDGGESRFAYDRLGRIVLSQNAKQKAMNPQRFSYTKYDGLGRVIEAGELISNSNTYNINELGGLNNGATAFTGLSGVNDPAFPENLASGRVEVTRSIYDELMYLGSGITIPLQTGSPAQVSALFDSYASLNTRNRIVGIIYQETYSANLNTYNNATFYDYDVHGNVKELIQVNMDQALLALNHHIKHINYDFDLVSGNVKKVTYQKGEPDQFIHRYKYDDDNRITHAETSKDDFYYEKDAKYFYYDHGPLARTEIGDKKVTASDYAYTIQGWLKAVNGEEIKSATTMGGDGLGGLNAYAGRDVYGYSLHYFAGDYNSSNTAMLNYSASASSTINTAGSSLYNGNIREMYTALSNDDELAQRTHRTVYKYDQLNRITDMDGAYMSLNSGGTVTANVSGYKSQYSYDANGNILTMKNWSSTAINTPTAPEPIDNLIYRYLNTDAAGGYYTPGPSGNSAPTATNRLAFVEDSEGSDPAAYGDIGGQVNGNYEYDKIGQLTKDVGEGITNIIWTVTNKVKEVHKSNQDIIQFDYDAMGRRIAKKVSHPNGNYEKTFYVLDAQGNVMSTYERKKTADVSSDKLYLADRNIYGSGRLGLEDVNLLMEYTDPLAVVTDMEELVSQKFNAGETSLGASWTRQATCPVTPAMSNVGGALQITNICSTQYDRFFTTEIGRTYEFQADFDVSLAENLFISFHVHPTDCSTNLSSQNLPVSTGHFSYTFTAISTCSRITIHNLGNSDNGGTFKIDNISFLRKIVNHREVSNEVGDKQYELANHLGNVLNVVTDRKLPFVYDSNTSGLVDYFTADVKSYSDYYPFGMQLPKRFGGDGYRYGFNGMEKDNEIKTGDGNSYTTEFRQYDPRLGRWLSIDPVTKEHRSPYDGFNNNPIIYVDPRGDDDYYNADGSYNRAKSKKHNKDGNNIYVLSADKKTKTLLADMPLKTTNQREVVERVIAGYARKVGIKNQVKLELSDKPASGNPAFTGSVSKNVSVNYTGGKMSEYTSNYHDLFSLLYHEKVHQDQPSEYSNDKLFSGLIQHMNVYIKQFEHSDFGKTSKNFKQAMFGSYAHYLNLAQKMVYDDVDQKKVDKAVKKFNDGIGKKYGYEMVTEVEYDQYYNETIKYVYRKVEKNKK